MSIYDSDNTLFVFCVTEDAGSDQKAQRLKLLTMLSAGLEDSEDPYQNVLFWDVNCLVHQFNLVVGSHLYLIDTCLKAMSEEFLYYSSLAKIIYTWRNNSDKMMSQYDVDELPSKQLPPAPCAARWGCVHEIETYLLLSGCKKVSANFVRVCEQISSRKSAASVKPSKSQQIDEVALDEYREYQVKMSKYMQSAVHAAQSATFWFFVHVSQASKEPLIECFAWLQKTKQSAIIKLVTEKAFEFSEKLRKLVTDRRWIVYCLEESGAKKTLPPDRQAQLINAASRIAAHNATAFERRIVEYITGFLN